MATKPNDALTTVSTSDDVLGFLDGDGNMDTAIAIRTALVKDGTPYIQAGGGVGAHSIPRLEWKESVNKGRAIFRAARMAELRFCELD